MNRRFAVARARGVEGLERRRLLSASIQLVPLISPTTPAASDANDQIGTRIDFRGNAGVVVWADNTLTGGHQRDVLARRFGANGQFIGNGFRVDTSGAGDQFQPDVAVFNDGSFVVVWSKEGAQTSSIVGRRFNANGSPNGGAFTISARAQFAFNPVVATSGDGTFDVAWSESDTDKSGVGVFARQYAADGLPTGIRQTTRMTVSLNDIFALPGA